MTKQAVVDEWIATAWTAIVEVITKLWEAFGEGIVIGVSAGAILGVATWWLEKRKRRTERRDQIHYIARAVSLRRGLFFGGSDWTIESAEFDRILEETGIKDILGQGNMRRATYHSLKSALEDALAGRASRLRYDEIKQIKDLIGICDLAWSVIPENEQLDERGLLSKFEDQVFTGNFEDTVFTALFKGFENIGWLKVQERTSLKRLWGRLWGYSDLGSTNSQ